MLTIIVSIAAVCVVIFFSFVNPVGCAWAPKCIFKLITGYQCPGCGASRALYALLHGHPLEALSYNYFLLLALPYLFAIVLTGWLPQLSRWKPLIQGPKLAWAYLVLFIIWWILRNILGL
jgi:hypothetical protein